MNSDKDGIDAFLDQLWLSDGLSQNTLAAYRADLTALGRWLEAQGSSLLKATRTELLAFKGHEQSV